MRILHTLTYATSITSWYTWHIARRNVGALAYIKGMRCRALPDEQHIRSRMLRLLRAGIRVSCVKTSHFAAFLMRGRILDLSISFSCMFFSRVLVRRDAPATVRVRGGENRNIIKIKVDTCLDERRRMMMQCVSFFLFIFFCQVRCWTVYGGALAPQVPI